MEIACSHCHTRVNIPDEKIPKGKKFSVTCPKCKEKIHIVPGENGPGASGELNRHPPNETHSAPANQPAQQMTAEYDAADKPFDFLDADAKTALLCIANPQAGTLAHGILSNMAYHIEKVDDIETALTRMKYHLFNVIIADDEFDMNRRGCAQLIKYLNEMDMTFRRKMVVLLLSSRLRSMDNMASFHLSVNQILNMNQITGMENLLQRTLNEHKQFYGIFNESLKKLGKAS